MIHYKTVDGIEEEKKGVRRCDEARAINSPVSSPDVDLGLTVKVERGCSFPAFHKFNVA